MAVIDPYDPQIRRRQSLLTQMTDDPSSQPLSANPTTTGPLQPSATMPTASGPSLSAPPPSATADIGPVYAPPGAVPTKSPYAPQPGMPTYETNTRVGNAPGADTGEPGTNPPAPPTPTTPGAGDRTGDSGARTGGATPKFTSASTYQDLINYLNSGHLDPAAAQAIVREYAQAHGLTGNTGNPNGLPWGEYDAQRQKYYIPGYDVRYENGQWVAHPWGSGNDSGGYDQATPTLSPEDQAFQAQLRDAILKLMGDSSKPVDMNDPTLANAVSAYRVPRLQAAQQERAAIAERAAAEGLNSGGQGSGAFDSGVQGINEQAGQDVAGFAGKTALDELNNRRALLTKALDLANAYGARTEAVQLQLALANLDARIKQQQYEDDMAYRYAYLNYLRDQSAVNTGANG